LFDSEYVLCTEPSIREGRYAPAPCGASDCVARGHRHTSTFVAELRLGEIDAPMLINGAINPASFLAYVQQVLVPTPDAAPRRGCDHEQP